MNKKVKNFVYYKSRSGVFFWRLSLGVIALACVLGWCAQYMPDSGHSILRELGADPQMKIDSSPELRIEILFKLLNDANTTFSEKLNSAPGLYFAIRTSDREKAIEGIRTTTLPKAHRQLMRLRLMHLFRVESNPNSELSELAGREPAVRFANRILGEFYRDKRETVKALHAFEVESQFDGANYSRRQVIDLLVMREDFVRLELLKDDPKYNHLFDHRVYMKIAIVNRDYLAIARYCLPQYQLSSVEWPYILLASLIGLGWFAFCLQAMELKSFKSKEFALAVFAVVLGILSVYPTLFLVVVEDEVFHLVNRGDLPTCLLHNVAGIGLREELCKLLLFSPLLIFLRKSRNTLLVFMLASCVGLGFAIEENVMYFSHSMGISGAGRYLTANFLHMTMTGMNGVFLWHCMRDPKQYGFHFMNVFAMTVVVHGLYDAFLSEPLNEYSFLTIVIFILISYQYFHYLRTLRSARRETLTLTGNFLLGVLFMCFVSIIFVSYYTSLFVALSMMLISLIELGIIIYMFLRELPDSLIE
jgi:protease PrsW